MGSYSTLGPCGSCGRCAWPTGELWEIDEGGDGELYCDACWLRWQKDGAVTQEDEDFRLVQRRKAGWRYLLLGPPPLSVEQPSPFRKLIGVAKHCDMYTDLLDHCIDYFVGVRRVPRTVDTEGETLAIAKPFEVE